jgi:hypothetical protein
MGFAMMKLKQLFMHFENGTQTEMVAKEYTYLKKTFFCGDS